MNQGDSAKSSLSRQIELGNSEAAKSLARTISADEVGAVLQQHEGSKRASVRILVLELAAEIPSEKGSRIILGHLQDGNLTVRSIANSLVGVIAQKSLIPELFKSMEASDDFVMKGALARQIGRIGDASNLPPLREYYRTVQHPGLHHDLEVAMVRLGDEPLTLQLIQRLVSLDLSARMIAIDDVLYVGDLRFARYFPSLVQDRRDAVVISLPHDPVVAARICDLAIQALVALGVKVSYPTRPSRRFSEREIEEMRRILDAMQH